jgi:glycosyltransferase involved in cell wall biosynthesis
MRLLITSDYVFYRKDEDLYSEVPWDEDFYALFDSVFKTIAIIGRIRNADFDVRNLHKVDGRYYEVVNIYDFLRPVDIFHPRNIKGVVRTIKAEIEKSDAIMLKLFYFYSLLAFFVNKLLYRRPAASLLVGDASQAALLRKDYIRSGFLRRLSSSMVFHSLRYIQNNVDLPGYVAEFLRDKYDSNNGDAVVANESWLKNWMYYNEDKEFHSNELLVLFVGRLIERKGVNFLIDALTGLISEGYPFRGVIVGDGPLIGTLQDRVRSAGCGDKIEFRLWLPALSRELFEEYRKAHIFVLPSYAEGLPLVILEAMANKCAVIATEVSGIPEIVNHKESGLLIKPGSSVDIAESLLRFYNDRELMERCARGGYRHSLENSFWSQRGKYSEAMLKRLGFKVDGQADE